MIFWCQQNLGIQGDDWLFSTGGEWANEGTPGVFWFKREDQLTQFVLAWMSDS